MCSKDPDCVNTSSSEQEYVESDFIHMTGPTIIRKKTLSEMSQGCSHVLRGEGDTVDVCSKGDDGDYYYDKCWCC
jgi:hypothetical protein